MTRELVPAKVSDNSLVTERRSHLVAAATELLLHQGFHDTSVREIAAAVGWQMGTLYLYISRKEDVLYLISQSVMAELWDGLKVLPEQETARASLDAAARYFFGAVARKRREIKLIYRESASLGEEHLAVVQDTELSERDFFAAIIRKGIETGEFRALNPDLMAHDIITLAHMWALKCWALADHMTFEDYVEQQLALLFEHRAPSEAVSLPVLAPGASPAA